MIMFYNNNLLKAFTVLVLMFTLSLAAFATVSPVSVDAGYSHKICVKYVTLPWGYKICVKWIYLPIFEVPPQFPPVGCPQCGPILVPGRPIVFPELPQIPSLPRM
jgi:hypothetical protein